MKKKQIFKINVWEEYKLELNIKATSLEEAIEEACSMWECHEIRPEKEGELMGTYFEEGEKED